VQAVVEPLMNNRTTGVYAMSGGDLVSVEMVMLTPDLAQRLAPVASLISPNPWLRPVR
jgi:hypothetical protein